MKKSLQRAITIVSLLAILLLFVFFLRDVLVPFIQLEAANDADGARELLVSRGVLGFLTVILVEALQMVVIFIPAEFIQISAGLSYPFPLALLLCDAGICLGATIIFVLVRVFRYSNDAYLKEEAKIDQLAAKARKDRGVVLLLYFLLIMPFIPFGAICYYGSSRDLKYRRYILTLATGAIPSIVTSILMGAATRYFVMNDLSLPVLVLIILLLALALFAVLFLFLDKIYFKENDGTPDSPVYLALSRAADLFCRGRAHVTADDSLLRGHEGPYLFLCRHTSLWDLYYVHRLIQDRNPAYALDPSWFHKPLRGWVGRKTGMIPADEQASKRILDTLHGGYSVALLPGERQAPSAALLRGLGVDIALGRIQDACHDDPPRRKGRRAQIDVIRLLTAEEIAAMTDDELQEIVAAALSSQATDRPPQG